MGAHFIHTPSLDPMEFPEIRKYLNLNKNLISSILVHNHPSGDPTPSKADIEMTKQVVLAGRPLGVSVHDHLIVGRDGVASLKALGLF